MSTSIAVAGAGVAGITAALALERMGLEATIYERAPSLRASGGALLLWPKAIRELERLGVAVTRLGAPLQAHELRTWRGDVAATVPYLQLQDRHGMACLLVPRAELLSALAEALGPGRIDFGQRVEQITASRSNVSLKLTDGARARCSLLIGADGLHSSARAFVVQGDPSARSARRIAWFGIAPGRHPLVEPGVAVTYFGEGFTFLYGALRDRSTYWYATAPEHARTDIPALLGYLKGSQEPLIELVEATPSAAVYVSELRDHAPSRPWSRGRVVLVGDSIHACAPDLGQGACQAIESACCLASHISQHASIEAAIVAYESERFARCALIATASRGVLGQTLLEEPQLVALLPAAFRGTPRSMITRMLDWLAG